MKFSAFFERVGFIEVFLFTKHLSVMVAAGIPITDALASLIEQAKSGRFKRILSNILADIENGKTLAESCQKYPYVFDEFYVNLIKVGEESGTLEESLSFLTDQLSKQYNLNQKVKAATMYPAVILIATLVMGGFISFFILPKLTDFFSSFEIALPPATRALLFFADLMKNFGVVITLGLILFIIIVTLLLQIPKIRIVWDSFILGLPLFGVIIAYDQLARFSRNFGVLIKNGLSVTKSLEVTAGTLENLRFREDVLRVSKSLSEGKNIGASLKKYFEFPPTVSRMVAIGEKSGQLDQVLFFLADFYEEEIDNVSKNLTTILEPVLLLTIGLVVGFIALAIISPIYELTGGIAR